MNITLQDIVKIFHDNSYWETCGTGRIKLVNKNESAKKIVELINKVKVEAVADTLLKLNLVE